MVKFLLSAQPTASCVLASTLESVLKPEYFKTAKYLLVTSLSETALFLGLGMDASVYWLGMTKLTRQILADLTFGASL